MLTIKILGSGCPNCRKLETTSREAAEKLGLQAEFIKVTDSNDLLSYHTFRTPGLVINEKVVCAGRVPGIAEVTSWLTNAQETA